MSAPAGTAWSWRLLRTAVAVLLVGAIGVFHVWSRTRVVSAGYALGELQREHVNLESEHDRLRIEVETLRSPAALEKVARTKLGMAPPAPGTVSVAGPRIAVAGDSGKGVVGEKHGPGTAEPSRHDVKRDSGGPLASRGPLRAGRSTPAGR
ncbi:MAG TPA: cell division protein FtsL [Anaeromyxobacter sp.]